LDKVALVWFTSLRRKNDVKPVVLKALHDRESGNEWSVRKFQQEMEALARVDHPSIVGIFDVAD